MKKILLIIGMISFLVSCEETTLDTKTTADEDITKIEVITGGLGPNIDPETGIEIPKFILTNSDVTFKSTTESSLIASSIWLIPQPEARPDTGDTTPINVVEFTTAEPTVQFLRGNETAANGEANGFVINLIETLNDGTINRASVQISVRQGLNPSIIEAPATRNVQTTIQPSPLGVLGLASTDFDTEFIWTVVDDAFFIAPDGSMVNELIVDDYVSTLNSIPVVFTATDGSSAISLQIIRNSPLPTTSEIVTFNISVFPGLLPNGGEFKDNIKLNSEGNQIRILYEDVLFSNLDIIQPSDYSINVNTTGTGISLPETTVNTMTSSVIDVFDDAGMPVLNEDGIQIQATEIILALSQNIPPLFMDNVTLEFSNENVLSSTDIPIAIFNNGDALAVSETGVNLMPIISLDFEEPSVWNAGSFFFPLPANTDEISFSTEQAFTGNQSLLFDTVGTPLSTFPNNFGIGTSVVTEDLPALENGTEYTFSMMAYVESAAPGDALTGFLLDFAVFNQGVLLEELPVGQWVVVNGTRVVGTDLRLLIRVVGNNVTGNSKVFVDHFDIRVADDGN